MNYFLLIRLKILNLGMIKKSLNILNSKNEIFNIPLN